MVMVMEKNPDDVAQHLTYAAADIPPGHDPDAGVDAADIVDHLVDGNTITHLDENDGYLPFLIAAGSAGGDLVKVGELHENPFVHAGVGGVEMADHLDPLAEEACGVDQTEVFIYLTADIDLAGGEALRSFRQPGEDHEIPVLIEDNHLPLVDAAASRGEGVQIDLKGDLPDVRQLLQGLENGPVHVEALDFALQDELLGEPFGLRRHDDDVGAEPATGRLDTLFHRFVEEQGKDQQGNQQGDGEDQDQVADDFLGDVAPDDGEDRIGAYATHDVLIDR